MKWLTVLFLVFASVAEARLEVRFIGLRDAHGRLVQLEPGGRFGHIAVGVGEKWLHVHPYRGVELVDRATVEKVGCMVSSIVVENLGEPDFLTLQAWLGLPYDREFSWKSEDAMYCSELVGKVLALEPEPMTFDPRLWPPQFQKFDGELGLSPDDIYRLLVEKGHRATEIQACAP
jgi:hypothetical protein